ncbi:MAG: hypothetical protein JRJ44_05255 [Deltaproteobacteria bacterium]|nr:hypothetical protein [Deltaproteobacteria bacterium]
MDTKIIVCLANSRRMSGRCIVGKEIKSKKWIRPISARETEKISEEEMSYKNGGIPNLLDIIKIPVKKHKPSPNQQENYLINDKHCWEKIGEYNKNKLGLLLDSPEKLWESGCPSYQGINDRIPEDINAGNGESVYLIQPNSLTIKVAVEGAEFNNPKRKVRAEFKYNNKTYTLSVTDPSLEKEYLEKNNGSFELSVNNIYLCVSLGGIPYKNYYYKFVASLIKV